MYNQKEEIDSYRAYLTLANYKTSTVSLYCRSLTALFEYVKENYGDQMPSQDHVQQYLLHRREQGLTWCTTKK